jgi:hypothetical protein
MSSSNRRILQSMLSNESNATRNDPHSNTSNPVRTRLASLLDNNTIPTNTPLPHRMTVAIPNGTVYQFASEKGGHLDAMSERNLLGQLGFTPVDSSLCEVPNELLYLNTDCYPYFKYHVGDRSNDDKRLALSTSLAMFACTSSTNPVTPEQQLAIDDYCKYNDNVNPMTKYLPYALGPLLFIFVAMLCHRLYTQRKEANEGQNVDVYNNSLSTSLLRGEEEKRTYQPR